MSHLGRCRPAAQRCCCYRSLLLSEVGRGSSATVYQLFYSDGIPLSLALKACSKPEDCDAEYNILKPLAHDNIIKCIGRPGFTQFSIFRLLGWFSLSFLSYPFLPTSRLMRRTLKVGTKRFLLLEMVEKGSLRSLYQSRKLEKEEIKLFAWQLLKAVEYLHAQHIVHGDIKCANCLVGKTKNLKLADFGRSVKLNGDRVTRGALPSVDWAAPEVFEPDYVYGEMADMYSLGCTLLEMFLERHPFPENSYGPKIPFCRKIPDVPTSPIIPESARKVIIDCLSRDPRSRPTAAQVRDYEYFQGVQDNGLQSVQNDLPSESSGLLIFETSTTPPFIEELPDSTPEASHISTCCMKKAWEWRDQPSVRRDVKLESVEDIFGRVRPPPRGCISPPSCFLNLTRRDDGNVNLENGGGR